MTENINLYDARYRPDCWVCDNPATYRVVCYIWIDDGEGRPPELSRDWGCEFICHRCALVNEANRVGTPAGRGSNVRYPFTKREVLGQGYTAYKLMNWPNQHVRIPVKSEHKWSREECQEHNWPPAWLDHDVVAPST